MKEKFLSRYTPRIMPPEVLEQIFVQREELAKQLVEHIRTSVLTQELHHTLLIGPRGIGKTHLVSLVHNRISEMADLRNSLLIAWLSEEEWSVTSFLDLLICIFHALEEDAKNGRGVRPYAPTKDIEALYDLSVEEAEAAGVKLLKEQFGRTHCKLIENSSCGKEDPPQPPFLRGENLVKVPLFKGDLGGSPDLPTNHNNSRTLLLIVENLDDLFAGLGKDGQLSLRTFLAETNCVILATSQSELKEIQQKKSPFYGFFELEKLEDLSAQEATQLLANIAEYKGNTELADFIQTPTGKDRINAVHFLAGGNPRIYVIFSEFLASCESLDELEKAFMATLDDLTPYYQERMKNLSPQQRKIVDILVRCGHAITVKEIAKAGFMSHQTASSQLKKLLEMSYVRTESYGREAFYELREPLMRFCLKTKQQRGKPIGLIVDFLRRWFTKSELQEWLKLVGADASREREYLLCAIQAFKDDDQDPRVVACVKEFIDCNDKKDYVSALQQVEKLVKIRGNALDWMSKGYCLDNLKRYEEVIASYDQALKIEPNYLYAWYNRGTALWNLGRLEEALTSYDQELKIRPDDHLAWFNRGGTLLYLGKLEEAVASYDQTLKIKPNFHEAWSIRGWALICLGRYEEALASCARTIELDSQSSAVFFNQAIALLALNQWEQGITSLEDGLNRLKNAEIADTEDAKLIIRNLFKNNQDSAIWKPRLTSLINLHNKYQAISIFAQGLVQSIPMLMSEMVSQKAAQIWLQLWQELGSDYPEFQIPLRLLETAVSYREKSDKRVLLNLPIEERKLLEPLLKQE